MSHQLDTTTGRPAIAYVGEKPWHGLGKELTRGAPLEVWRTEAGLDYEVVSTPVMFDRVRFEDLAADVTAAPETVPTPFPGRRVLYRSDTGAPLSVVSKNYKIVQPSEVLEFFGQLAEIGGFDLETAGALFDGKRIWGLARVNDGAPVIGQDIVRPYVLLATSYDGTLATTAKFTSIRVVCNNTLTMSVGGPEATAAGFRQAKYEEDTQDRAVASMVKVPHSNTFDAEKTRLALGIVGNVFERWLVDARILAEKAMTDGEAEVFVTKLLDSFQPKDPMRRVDVTKTSGFESIMSLFNGGAIGSDLTGGKSRWAMLNALTEHVDHHQGRTANTRMTSAWFGVGEGMKNRAFEMLRDEQFA